MENSSFSLEIENQGTLGIEPKLKNTNTTQINEIINPVIRQKTSIITDQYNEITLTFKGNYRVVFNGEINLNHLSPSTPILQNMTGETISWKVRFYGHHKNVYVNGKMQQAYNETTEGDNTVSYIEIMVAEQEEIRVSVLE